MVVYDEIRAVLNILPSVHKDVLTRYLHLRFDIPMKNAQATLHKAIIAHVCFEVGEYITLSANSEITSRDLARSRAFQVALEFMALNDADFITSRILPGHSAYCVLYVIIPPVKSDNPQNDEARQNRLIQICNISDGNERVLSNVLAKEPVDMNYRNELCRIGLVSRRFNERNMKKVGFVMFVPFAEGKVEFDSEQIISVDDATRWDDVQE